MNILRNGLFGSRSQKRREKEALRKKRIERRASRVAPRAATRYAEEVRSRSSASFLQTLVPKATSFIGRLGVLFS